MPETNEDIRAKAAAFYDATPPPFDDLPFYRAQLPSPDAQVLELGCGTGRVLVPLAKHCAAIHGVDISRSMLERCRQKIKEAGLGDKARIAQMDIARLKLGQRYDLIIAPFRVMQTLTTDEQVDRALTCIGFHLKPGGVCILNVFHPESDRETMLREWVNEAAVMLWEKEMPEGKLKHFERRSQIDPDPLVIQPELIYRLNRPDNSYDQVTVRLAMRCWYPDEFIGLIRQHGFKIIDRWGGYAGEEYGKGPELVVAFHG